MSNIFIILQFQEYSFLYVLVGEYPGTEGWDKTVLLAVSRRLNGKLSVPEFFSAWDCEWSAELNSLFLNWPLD